MRPGKRVLAWLLIMASITSAIAQVSMEKKITIDFDDLPLDLALQEISANYDIKFAFDVAPLQGIKVTEKMNKKPLSLVLERLLSGTGLSYRASPLGILITPGNLDSEDKQKENPASLITLEGSITDSQSGETLPFASIYIPATGKGTTSNADGFFTLHQVPDTATVMVSYLGYHAQEIKPVSGSIKVQLRAQAQQLEEIVVVENVEAIQVREEAGRVVFNPRKLTELPNLGRWTYFGLYNCCPA